MLCRLDSKHCRSGLYTEEHNFHRATTKRIRPLLAALACLGYHGAVVPASVRRNSPEICVLKEYLVRLR
jgi:hypothetical protein